MTTFDTRFGKKVDIYYNPRETFTLAFYVFDQNDDAVDLSAKDLTFSIRSTENGTAVATLTKTASEIVVSGDDSNLLTFTKDLSALSDNTYYCDLINTTDSKCIIDGLLKSRYEGR